MKLHSYHSIAKTARILLLFMLFTQIALASSACLGTANELAKTLRNPQQSCHDSSNINLNLCLAHCSADSQTLGTGAALVAVPPQTIAPLLILPVVERRTIRLAHVQVLKRAKDPPIPILFCSFLI